MYLGPPVGFIFVEIEGSIDEGQCVVQFYIREFRGSAWVRHLSDGQAERGVVYLHRKAGNDVKPVIVNRILAPVTLGYQQCGELDPAEGDSR